MLRDRPFVVCDRRLQISLVLGVLTALAGTSFAGDWKLTDSVTTELTVVDRTGNDASSGLVAQVTPRLTLNGQGGRSRASVDYGLTASLGSSNTDPEALSHDLRAEGELEAIENFFFLGGRAGAALVGNSATSGRVDSISANNDGRQTYSLEITPRFRHRLNRYANIVSNNAIDYVDSTGGSGGSGDDSSYGTTVNIGVTSGPVYGPLSWGVSATQSRTDFDDREDKTTEADVQLGYQLDRRWRLTSSVGYEDNEVQTDRDNTDGVTWNVGTVWTPNPRTSATLSYGQRYIGSIYSGTLTHRTRKTNLTVDLSRDVTNRRSLRLSDPFFQPSETGSLIRTVDGVRGDFVTTVDETDENFVNTRLRVAVALTGRRTTVTFTGDVSNREFEVSDIDEDSYGLGLNVSRQLGGGYSASLAANYDQADDTSSGDSNTYDLSLSLSKQLSPNTSASVEVLHRERSASNSDDDFSENRIAVSLSTSFL